jgi:hypothetical protein
MPAPLARGEPPTDLLTAICTSFLESVAKTFESPFGPSRFAKEFKELADWKLPRGKAGISGEYLDRVYREWLNLEDPEFHLKVLQFPVPEIALDIVDLAAANLIDAKGIEKLLVKGGIRPHHKPLLVWLKKMITHSRLMEGERLALLTSSYRKTGVLIRDGVRFYSGVPSIPAPKPDHVRMYKGSNFFKGPSISSSQIGKSLEEIPSGGEWFLSHEDARLHSVRAEAFHPDGVSVSTDRSVPMAYGSHIRVYDVPAGIASKLPRGAPELCEYVFRFSVPEEYRVMTLPRATFVEAFKMESAGALSYSIRMAAEESGAGVIGALKEDPNPVHLRGRSQSLVSLYADRVGDLGGMTIQGHTLQVLAQFEKYSAKFPWIEILAPPNIHLKRTIRMAYALHDIGKPLAAGMGVAHEPLSAEILFQLMNRYGFSKAEVELAQALVGNDAIGKMLQGGITPQEAFERLVEISRRTSLNPNDFFKLQSFFYTMDASTYPDLAALFTKEGTAQGEVLIPRNEKFKVLRNLFSGGFESGIWE